MSERVGDALDSIIVMGVSGSGKSTIAREIAERWGCVFLDADELHNTKEIHQMVAGHPLTDEDRRPWLRRVGDRIRSEIDAGQCTVTACSALKRAYRDLLRDYAPEAFFVWLDGPIEVVHARMTSRHGHFMPASLLASQYATLEPLDSDELGVRIDLTEDPTAIIREIERALDRA